MNSIHINVLLATYNGERHLTEQLNSITQQTGVRVKISASDDGSTDQTHRILNDYSIEAHPGPQQGFAANFLHLITKADEQCDYFSFSDQDDVWELDKLHRASQQLASIPASIPGLYCSRTTLVDEQLTPYGHSSLFKKKPSFLNALVQNIAGGNTMVFNRAALQLLRQTMPSCPVVAHDWWLYLLVSGAGGQVVYDPTPTLLYRQHPHNMIGNNTSWRARYKRVRLLLKGQLKTWIDQNNTALAEAQDYLSQEQRQQFIQFEANRRLRFLPRLIKTLKLGVYRQTRLGQLGLWLALMLNKL